MKKRKSNRCEYTGLKGRCLLDEHAGPHEFSAAKLAAIGPKDAAAGQRPLRWPELVETAPPKAKARTLEDMKTEAEMAEELAGRAHHHTALATRAANAEQFRAAISEALYLMRLAVDDLEDLERDGRFLG